MENQPDPRQQVGRLLSLHIGNKLGLVPTADVLKAHGELAANDPQPEPVQTQPEPNPFPSVRTKAYTSQMFQARKEGARKLAAEVAEQHGFPIERVNISDETPELELNGKTSKVAGHYFPAEDTINLYHKHIRDHEDLRDILTHEIGHHRFNYVNERNDPDSKAAWAYTYYNQNKLAADDGVTKYSRDWWKAAQSGEARPHQAINETLAEMMMLATRGHRHFQGSTKFNVLHHFAGIGIKPSWIKTFELYHRAYLKSRINELSQARNPQRPTSPNGQNE